MRPRKLPRIPRRNNQGNQPQGGPNNTDNNIQNEDPNINNNQSQSGNNINQMVQQGDESDYIRKLGKFRNRHREDYSISLNPDREDIVNEEAKLYDNRDINLDAPKINEDISLANTEFYIESIHHDQYYKINKITKEEKKNEEILGEPKIGGVKKRKKVAQKKLSALEKAKAIEDNMYKKVDKELTDVITKTLSKVTLIFLFAQGLLAGMGLLHFLVCLTSGLSQLLAQFQGMIIIMFNIFHALTFTSLVGNGIKFVSSYQKYNLISEQINYSTSLFTRLRQNMIFSGILLVFFTIAFILEIYLATFVQKINLNKCLEGESDIINSIKLDPGSSEFTRFRIFFMILDILIIVLFVLNIFDLNVEDENTEKAQRPINVSFYLGSEPTEDGVTIM